MAYALLGQLLIECLVDEHVHGLRNATTPASAMPHVQVPSNPLVAAMAMVPNRMDAARDTGPTYPPGIYFLHTRTNAGTINATNPDPSVVTVPISA